MMNLKIRRQAKAAGVPLWRIADALGVSEPTLTRWLRHPLDKDKEQHILGIIAEMTGEA